MLKYSNIIKILRKKYDSEIHLCRFVTGIKSLCISVFFLGSEIREGRFKIPTFYWLSILLILYMLMQICYKKCSDKTVQMTNLMFFFESLFIKYQAQKGTTY